MNHWRILALIFSLNAFNIHAGNESNVLSQMIIRGAQQVVVVAGIVCFFDGLVEIADEESLLPSASVSDSSTVNGGCKAAFGALLFVAGQPSK